MLIVYLFVGSGAGGILFGVVVPMVVESRGWRGAMQVLSYITLAYVIMCVVMIPVKEASKKPGKGKLLSLKSSSIKKEQWSTQSPWRNPAFVVLSITIIIGAFVSTIPYCHIVSILFKNRVFKNHPWITAHISTLTYCILSKPVYLM